MLAAQITKAPEPVASQRPACPAELAEAVMCCLEKRPADRWQTAEELHPQLAAMGVPGFIMSSPYPPVRERGTGSELPGGVAIPEGKEPNRLALRNRVLPWAVAALIVLTAALYLQANRTRSAATAGSAPRPKSIAVLPLVNTGGDSTQDYWSDGLTDELIGALGKLPGLRVAARSSAFAFKGKNPEARESDGDSAMTSGHPITLG